jgi:hypothetical protein
LLRDRSTPLLRINIDGLHKAARPHTLRAEEFAMRALALAFVAGVTALTVGCGPEKRHEVFVEAEYAPYAAVGSCTITGQAFLRTRGGEVRLGAGCEVVLAPQTSYTREVWQRTIVSEDPVALEEADPRATRYVHKVIADGEGRFEFPDLPLGEYFLACAIEWEVATSLGPMNSGGIAHAEAHLKKLGETVKVVVTR